MEYNIQEAMRSEYPTLINLIKKTESMDDDERQYWFDIMPSMTPKQIKRLEAILTQERKALAKLEEKYQKEIRSLNETHLREWEEFNAKKLKEQEEQNKNNTNVVKNIWAQLD